MAGNDLKDFADATALAFQKIGRRLKNIEVREASPTTYAVQTNTFAALPAPGTSRGQTQFCSNCRKVGEGAGTGTGTIVYTDGTGFWLRIRDDTHAAV